MKRDEKIVTVQEVKPKRKRTAKKIEVTTGVPTEEHIRSRARDIYHERLQNGEYGTPESDWFDALESLTRA